MIKVVIASLLAAAILVAPAHAQGEPPFKLGMTVEQVRALVAKRYGATVTMVSGKPDGIVHYQAKVRTDIGPVVEDFYFCRGSLDSSAGTFFQSDDGFAEMVKAFSGPLGLPEMREYPPQIVNGKPQSSFGAIWALPPGNKFTLIRRLGAGETTMAQAVGKSAC